MTDYRVTRRGLMKLGAGAALAAGGIGVTRSAPARAGGTHYPSSNRYTIHLAGTDGWLALPDPANPKPWFPDSYAPAGRSIYVFGFRDVTGMAEADILAQKNKAQGSAPLLWVDELDDVTIELTNLGLAQRPDLTDGHTIHWHGFRNATPIFDGIPEVSVGVPVGRTFPYYYKPRFPGTYMYHCHFEDVEHVQMGMTGIVFVRPLQNTAGHRYVYNDGDGSTEYDREFALMQTDWWSQAHWNDAHIQESDWSDFKPDVWLLNGRTYPDTLAPNTGFDTHGAPDPGPADGRLAYQPISSVVRGEAGGERVLVRMANLGYQQHVMTLAGLQMRVVGKDAMMLRGRDGTDLSYLTSEVTLGPGESADAIITTPGSSLGSGGSDEFGSYDLYPFYARDYANAYLLPNGEHSGQRTEVRVYSPGTLGPQTTPNQ